MSNESNERPAPPGNSVLDMVKAGQYRTQAMGKIDPVLYDPITGAPVQMGNTDPNVIGADDDPQTFAYRGPNAYPDVPPQVKEAEVSFILPMAQFIASTLNITVLDETAYDKVIPALRSRALFVVLNLHKTKVADGTASWFGMILPCRRHVVAMVRFKLRLSTRQIGIDQIRLWDSRSAQYVVHAGPDGKFMTREETSAKILNYIRNEGIVPTV